MKPGTFYYEADMLTTECTVEQLEAELKPAFEQRTVLMVIEPDEAKIRMYWRENATKPEEGSDAR